MQTEDERLRHEIAIQSESNVMDSTSQTALIGTDLVDYDSWRGECEQKHESEVSLLQFEIQFLKQRIAEIQCNIEIEISNRVESKTADLSESLKICEDENLRLDDKVRALEQLIV